MGKDRRPEAILLGSADRRMDINLQKLAPAVGSTPSTLCKWRKNGFPEPVKIFARLCRERGMTREQIGKMVEEMVSR